MARHPVSRIAQLVTGVVLIIASPIIGAIPGPGGIFVFVGGLVLVLRNSLWARRRWARTKRRWPKLGDLSDRVMRRRSAQRRRQNQVVQNQQARDRATLRDRSMN